MTFRAALVLVTMIPGVLAGQQGQQRQQDAGGERRAELESRFRQQFARVVRQRVGLTEAQMAQLGPMNERHSQQRRVVQMQERAARISLQRVLRNPSLGDSAEVSRLLEQLVDTQKRRAALLEAEQRDLATIMTPIQRVRYMALQEQVRRQLEQRRDRGGGGSPQGRRRPPPR